MKKAGTALLSLCFLAGAPEASEVARGWTVYPTADEFAGNAIQSIGEDGRGYLWFISLFGGARRYDGARFEPVNTTRGLASNNIYHVLFDRQEDRVWLATDRGVSRYDGRRFTNLDTSDGLGDNHVNFVLKDTGGRLWFATDRGVSRYDGDGFQNLPTAEVGGGVNVILEDRHGALWFGTRSGVFRNVSGRLERVPGADIRTPIHVAFEDTCTGDLWFGGEGGLYRKTGGGAAVVGPLLRARISGILKDRAGRLLVATADRGAHRYRPQDGLFVPLEGLAATEILSMLEDSRGALWFGTDRGVSRHDGRRIESFEEIEGIRLGSVQAICEDRDGNLWFGAEKGAFKYTIETLRQYTTADGLADNRVRALVEDDEGNLWFGTASGLSRYDRETFQTVPLGRNGSDNSQILCLYRDREGDLWTGTTSGVYENLRRYRGEHPWLSTAVRQVVQDARGNMWFAAVDGVVQDDGRSLRAHPLEGGAQVFADSRGDVWIGSWSAGLYRVPAGGQSPEHYTGEDGLASDHVTWITESRQGDLWFGLKAAILPRADGSRAKGGVGRHDGLGFRCWGPELPTELVRSAAEGGAGIMWFATDKGVLRYDPRPGRADSTFALLTRFHGLLSNHVASVFVDRAGNLWSGTNNGVSKYDGANFYNILLQDRTTFGVERFYQDSQGSMWFLTRNSGAFEYPVDRAGPRIHLTQVEADRVYTEHLDELRIPTATPRITFEYKAISFNTRPGKMRYRYMLEGHDREERSSAFDRVRYEEGLAPGQYRFKVRAIGEDLHFSEPAITRVTLYEPFHRTSGFIALLALAGCGTLGGALYLVVQLRRQRRLTSEFREGLRRQEEAQRIQAAKMESLRQFVAGVAHEVNNPIGALAGGSDAFGRAGEKLKQMLAEKLPGGVAADAQLGRVFTVMDNTARVNREASQRIAAIVANMRRFARLDEAEWDSVDISEGIDTVIALLEPELGGRIEVEKSYGEVPQVYCSLSSLNQVFMAVLKNAAEAIEDRGRISVGTWADDSGVGIEIGDTGKGIPPDVQSRIFDPGFTTKGVKVGVGLGLSICNQIVVNEHRGEIHVESEPGQGTTVKIRLPLHPEQPPAG